MRRPTRHHSGISHRYHAARIEVVGSVEHSKRAAIQSRNDILEALRGANAGIIVAGLGGNTGTSASPVVAKYAREIGALSVAVVTLPYIFEGVRRNAKAETALKNLSANADAVIKIRNDEILQIVAGKTPLTHTFKYLDEILYHAVRTLLVALQNQIQIADVR